MTASTSTSNAGVRDRAAHGFGSPPDAAGLARRIRVARGDAPGDLLLTGGRVVNVFTLQVEPADVVIADGVIAGVGPHEWTAERRIDVSGRFLVPGLIDAHMHVESTLLAPAALARLVVPRGTAALIADPHEIGNVLGAAGVELLIAASRGLPLDIFYMAPSCVPALPWERAGAALGPDEIDRLLDHPGVLGLAEMMNFPGVVSEAPDVLAKIVAAARHGAVVDGHAPGLMGRDLAAYASAGIRSDHECTTAEEAAARAALGMLVQVREGSIARNLDEMLPLIVDDRLGDWCLCTDDVHPDDLLEHGHLDALLARVVGAGVCPARAVRHASLVPARHYGFTDRGGLAPGYRADVVAVENLESFRATDVVKDGVPVVEDGEYVPPGEPPEIPIENTVRLGPLDAGLFSVEPSGDSWPVIGIVPDQIVTRHLRRPVRRPGPWTFEPEVDQAMVACLERHRATSGHGVGLVEGFGFRRPGAIGSSVAHDSHNLIIAGTNAADMLACARALQALGGGFVVANGGTGEITAELPLPLAGLMTVAPAEQVCRGLHAVRAAAAELGCGLSCPFGTLSFLALSVIPELRITDQGLFDVVTQSFLT